MTDNTVLEVSPILEKLEEAETGIKLAQPEVESLLNFIEIMSKTADKIAQYAAGLENQVDDLNIEREKGNRAWTP